MVLKTQSMSDKASDKPSQNTLDALKGIVMELVQMRDYSALAFLLDENKRDWQRAQTDRERTLVQQSSYLLLRADPQTMGSSNALQMKSDAQNFLKGGSRLKASELIQKSQKSVVSHNTHQTKNGQVFRPPKLT